MNHSNLPSVIEITGPLFATPSQPINLRVLIYLDFPEAERVLLEQRTRIIELFREVQAGIESIGKTRLNGPAEMLFEKSLMACSLEELRAMAAMRHCDYVAYDVHIAENTPMGYGLYDCEIKIAFTRQADEDHTVIYYPTGSLCFAMTAVEVHSI